MGLRILWQSNAPWCQTGYGVQANSLLPRMIDMKDCVDEVAMFCYYGINGPITKQRVGLGTPTGRPRWVDCYPPRSDMWGNDVIGDHAKDFKADVVISIVDIWVQADDFGHRGFRWVPYMPIDMEPTPRVVREKMWKAFRPMVYSKFALQECAKIGITADYIPLGVETSIYKPYRGDAKRMEAREVLGLPKDAFIVGTVGANKGYPPRKGYPELFEAFGEFHKLHPDSILYCHTLATEEFQGLNLQKMAEDYGILPWVMFPDPYGLFMGYNQDTMAALYNAFDVFCLPSMGEGFGVPVIEAQASGCPVIMTEWTALRELMGAGWFVPIASRVYSPLGSWQGIAHVPSLVEAMNESYKADRKKLGKQAREFALEYDWDNLAENYWHPYLQQLNQEITPRHYLRP